MMLEVRCSNAVTQQARKGVPVIALLLFFFGPQKPAKGNTLACSACKPLSSLPIFRYAVVSRESNAAKNKHIFMGEKDVESVLRFSKVTDEKTGSLPRILISVIL
jgi:hypothetical protein